MDDQQIMRAVLDNLNMLNKMVDAMIEREELIASNLKETSEIIQEYIAKI